MRLEQLEVAGGQPQAGRGQVGVIHEGGAARVLAVGVPARRPAPRAGHHGGGGGVAGQPRDAAREAEGGVEVEQAVAGGGGAELGAEGEVLGVARPRPRPGQDLQARAHDGGGAGRVAAAGIVIVTSVWSPPSSAAHLLLLEFFGDADLVPLRLPSVLWCSLGDLKQPMH